MASSDFVPFAAGSGANVVSPAVWRTTAAQQTGFQDGEASAALCNTAWRQSSFVAAMIAQFIADTLAQNVYDNGNLAQLEAQFIAAITAASGAPPQAALWHWGRDTGGTNALSVTTFPIIAAYADGMVIETLPGSTNTGASTLSACGLSPAPVYRPDASALQQGDIQANLLQQFIFDSHLTAWRTGTLHPVSSSQVRFGADTSTTPGQISANVLPAITSYSQGVLYEIILNQTSSGGTLINLNGLANRTLVNIDGSAIVTGCYRAGQTHLFSDDGTNIRLLTPLFPAGTQAPLQGAQTFYVNASGGSDTNTGVSPGAAFATIQRAITALQNVNLNGFNATILVSAGTYAPFVVRTLNGSGGCSIIGDTANPANVTIHATAGEAIYMANAINYTLGGMRVQSDGAGGGQLGCGLRLESSVCGIYNMEFGPCFYAQVFADSSSRLNFLGGAEGNPAYFVNLNGGAQSFLYALSGSVIDLGKTILNQSGAINFSQGFAQAGQGAAIQGAFSIINLTGTVTGARYNAYANGVINTYGAGQAYFPGNSGGVTPSGGQYL